MSVVDPVGFGCSGVRQFGEGVARRGDGRDVVGADDGDVGAVDRDADRRVDDAAMAVIDLDDVVEDQRLALGDEVERASAML